MLFKQVLTENKIKLFQMIKDIESAHFGKSKLSQHTIRWRILNKIFTKFGETESFIQQFL